ncbi:MAG: NAD(P)-dependent oxidoreductase [Planctomycetota bacterium]
MPDQHMHIVFAEEFDDAAVERMRSVGRVTILDACDEATLAEAIPDCDALLVRSSARVTRALLDRAKRLRVIGRGGVGLENIDLEAARERGIAVVYTPAAATDAVADLTVGLLIGLVRQIRWADTSVREERFREARERARFVELQGLTLGIIGLGRIGRAVARRCRHGFGMPILYNDIVFPGHLDFVATPVSKDELYGQADVVSLHVPLTEQTRHLIDDGALAHFKPGSLLINTARGAVVDSEALVEALCSGRLGGAALDVFEPEPVPAGHPLQRAPNTLFTPHIGARTRAGLSRMNAVVDDVIGVLKGGPARFPAWT